MGLKYVVKKRVFGFDKTKTEKYVAHILLPIQWILSSCATKCQNSD